LSPLYRNMAQQKLNLFQFAARTVAQASTRSSEVVRREGDRRREIPFQLD